MRSISLGIRDPFPESFVSSRNGIVRCGAASDIFTRETPKKPLDSSVDGWMEHWTSLFLGNGRGSRRGRRYSDPADRLMVMQNVIC